MKNLGNDFLQLPVDISPNKLLFLQKRAINNSLTYVLKAKN